MSWTGIFRRTTATILDDSGQSARQVADQLGHSRPCMSQDVYMGRRSASPPLRKRRSVVLVAALAAELLVREPTRGLEPLHLFTRSVGRAIGAAAVQAVLGARSALGCRLCGVVGVRLGYKPRCNVSLGRSLVGPHRQHSPG